MARPPSWRIEFSLKPRRELTPPMKKRRSRGTRATTLSSVPGWNVFEGLPVGCMMPLEKRDAMVQPFARGVYQLDANDSLRKLLAHLSGPPANSATMVWIEPRFGVMR